MELKDFTGPYIAFHDFGEAECERDAELCHVECVDDYECHADHFREAGGDNIPCIYIPVSVFKVIPELFAACNKLLPYLSTGKQMLDHASLNDGRASEFDSISVKLRAALAKAEGK